MHRVYRSPLTKVAGDFHDAASVRNAVVGHEAVIVCASPTRLSAIREERLARDSGLDVVIARPTRLTNGEAKGKYVRTAATRGASRAGRCCPDQPDMRLAACDMS